MRGMNGLGGHRHLMAGVAIAALTVSAGPALAQTRSFNVPEGLASTTIPVFAKQAGIQVLASGSVARGKRTKTVKGSLTVQEGLRRLLKGTGLAPMPGANGIITIGAAPVGNGQETPGADEAENDETRGRAEILVIGGRSRNVDVKRTEDDAQPYVIFDREEIVSSQATTVEEFLRSRLTSNTQGPNGSNSQVTGNGSSYSSFNLRGLGTNQTLILVNGRRLPALANQNLAPGQADVNGIPIGSIERIEVLPASAGGIYGGNAVGGVINIILRSNYRGLEISATYNDTFDFHAPNGRIDVNGGFALEGGRTNITFGGSISRSGTLRLGDRQQLVQDGIDLYRSHVDVLAGTGYPPIGNGVNIRSSTGAILTLDPEYGGTSLGSAVTNLPLGYAGVASDNGALLVANAGKFNLDMPDDLLGKKRGLLTSPQLGSFNVNVRRKFSELFDVSIDYAHLENHGLTYSVNQAPTTVTLAANAPTNPFQQAIRVTYINPGLSFPYKRESKTDTLSGGIILRLPHDWAANVEYNKTWTTNRGVFYQAVIDATGTACLNSGQPCTGGVTLNPLQSPIDYGQFLFTEPTYLSGPYNSQFDNPSLRVSGPLFKLPGGSANMTLAIQREATTIDTARNSIVDTNNRGRFYVIFPGRKQSTTSEYGEVVLPLIKPSNGIPFLRELELTAAVRHDAYYTEAPPAGDSYIDYRLSSGTLYTQMSGYGSIATSDPNLVIPSFTPVESRFQSTNYTLAARWSPIGGVTFRTSYATGFLPPSVVQIASQETAAPYGLGIADPQRGNEIINYAITQKSGSGSASLRPELSKTLSAGVILAPIEGLRFTADYVRISKTDEIGSIPYSFLLANPDLFPGRVVREPTVNGVPGRIISLDVTPINLYKSLYQAIDFQFDYAFETRGAGKFRVYALASWQPDALKQLLPQAELVNYTDNRDGPLLWQGNGGVDWTKGGLSVRWNTQFWNSYNIYYSTDTAATRTATIAQQGAQRIPVQTYSDLYVSYDFRETKGALNGVRISAGIQNIFDKTPPVIAISSYTQAGYSTYGDPRLRRFTLSLRKAFGDK